ncbi:MAG TPA: S1 RNA-binding domain-containing protein [Candidatus Absconditabacterales bacterium]|nr:S1 RNA-binding domain-containing protein [Candidatus Absconditabacterales bacterium]
MAKKAKSSSYVSELNIPKIREGQKIKGTVLKKVSDSILVDCEGGIFTGIILSKEVKDLERNNVNLTPGAEIEAEIINPSIRHEHGFFIISISKLLQVDIWKGILEKAESKEVFTVVPTEANLGGLLVDMHGIKGFIPLSQLAPVHYPRVEDGDQEKIFDKLLNLIGQEFKVRVINIDEEEKRIILSEREALKEERDAILSTLKIGNEYEGQVSGISSYGLFVTIGGGIEGLVHISEITYGHVNDIDRLAKVGEKMKVEVIGLEDGKISLSSKKLRKDPWSIIPEKYSVGDVIEGQVVRFVPYGVFIRIYEDINGLIHISELADKNVSNPIDIVKPGQIIRAKIILLDPKNRKIGLSIKAAEENGSKTEAAPAAEKKTTVTKKTAKATA